MKFLPFFSLLLGAASFLGAVAPSAPVGLVATAGTGTIGLNWTDTANATTYRVYEATTDSGPWTLIATRDRSRHLVSNAPAATPRYYRVTAVNAGNEESVASAVVSATANALSINRAATGGHYRMGSSFVTDGDRLQRFLEARSLNVPSRRFQIIGAPIEFHWSNTLATNPTSFNTEITQLQSGSYDVLVMNAQRPYEQAERELDGTLLFAEETLAARPNYRIFIHEYWSDEYLAASSLWAENLEGNNRARQQQWYWLASVALAYEATQYLGTPVYVAPIGSGVDAAKAAAVSGQLQAYTSRTQFHTGDQHLNALGKYIQEGVVAAGAYQIDVRGTHQWVDNSTTLSANDAAVLQQVIHDTVRNTPFSGWHDGAPTNLAAYLQAMREALRVRESFSHFTATGSGSVANPITGLTWTFTGVNGFADGFGGNIAEYPLTRLDRKIRLNAGGTLSTTLPRGLSAFTLRLRQVSGGTATVQVKANGNTVATFTNPSTVLYGREVRDLELGGSVTLLLTNTGAGVVEIDDLIWDEPPVSPSGLSILTEDLVFLAHQQPYSRQLTASGGSGSYIWSVSGGSLPAGLSLSASGLLSGTPTAQAQNVFTLRIADANDGSKTAERTYQTTVVGNTAITTHPQSLEVALGDPVSFSVSAVGTNLIYEWYLGNTLLPGSNTPNYTIPNASALNAGVYTVKVIGSGGTVTSNPATLTVDTGGAQVLTTRFTGGTQGEAGNTFDLKNNGPFPIVLTGALQGNFNATSGLVVTAYTRSGTANGFATSASGWTLWGVSDSFTGSGYGTATPFTIKSGGQPATVTIAPGATLGVYLLITSGGKQISYTSSSTTYTSGNLLFTPQQGLGSGTGPFTTGVFGPSRLFNGSITFYEDSAPVINTTPLATARVGAAYSRTFTAPGGNGVPEWVLSGTLPAGISFNAETGVLSGRPTQSGSFPISLTATDDDGDVDSANFTLTVIDPFIEWLTAKGLPTNTDPNSDPMNEGVSLLVRHAMGLPTDQSVQGQLPTLVVDGGTPLFTLTRNLAATGVILRIELSADLVDWSDAYIFSPTGGTEIAAFINDRSDDGSTETLTLQFAELSATNSLFIRISVEPAYPAPH